MLLALQGQVEPPALQGILVVEAYKASQDPLVLRVLQDHLVVRVLRGLQGTGEVRVFRDLRALLVPQAKRVTLDQQELKDPPV